MPTFPNCPICIESFDDLSNIAACACGHTFHYGCIVGWAKRCQKENQPCLCPSCKTRFETNPARGVVKKLYFTFDSSCAKGQNGLQKKLDLAEGVFQFQETHFGFKDIIKSYVYITYLRWLYS